MKHSLNLFFATALTACLAAVSVGQSTPAVDPARPVTVEQIIEIEPVVTDSEVSVTVLPRAVVSGGDHVVIFDDDDDEKKGRIGMSVGQILKNLDIDPRQLPGGLGAIAVEIEDVDVGNLGAALGKAMKKIEIKVNGDKIGLDRICSGQVNLLENIHSLEDLQDVCIVIDGHSVNVPKMLEGHLGQLFGGGMPHGMSSPAVPRASRQVIVEHAPHTTFDVEVHADDDVLLRKVQVQLQEGPQEAEDGQFQDRSEQQARRRPVLLSRHQEGIPYLLRAQDQLEVGRASHRDPRASRRPWGPRQEHREAHPLRQRPRQAGRSLQAAPRRRSRHPRRP